jgi:hypothetical protein
MPQIANFQSKVVLAITGLMGIFFISLLLSPRLPRLYPLLYSLFLLLPSPLSALPLSPSLLLYLLPSPSPPLPLSLPLFLTLSIRYNVHGPSTIEPIMEIIHRQVEACDSLGGFFLMQSLAGGTGSGVGIISSLLPHYPLFFTLPLL